MILTGFEYFFVLAMLHMELKYGLIPACDSHKTQVTDHVTHHVINAGCLHFKLVLIKIENSCLNVMHLCQNECVVVIITSL